MKRFSVFIAFALGLAASGANSLGASEAPQGADVNAARRIENRGELLTAVNAWMESHHQPKWTMEELICCSVGQAETIFFSDDDGTFDPPVESLFVSLIKNQPFTHEVTLRSDWRNGIEVRTADGEIDRQRNEWRKVLKGQKPWTAVKEKQANHPRWLAVPPHYTLTLQIETAPVEVGNDRINPNKLTRWGICLATALPETKPISKESGSISEGTSAFVATPEQLLTYVNAWKRKLHGSDVTLDDITARVADEAIAIKEAKRDLWNDVELFLECLAKNKPFVYPMRMSSGMDEELDVHSKEERLPLPPNNNVSVDVLDLPWGVGGPAYQLKIDWTRIWISYAVPAN